MSFVSCGCALPEKIFSSPNPVAINPSPLRGRFITSRGPPPPLRRRRDSLHSLACLADARWRSQRANAGWGGRIRTFEYGIQRPAPYHLATPHHVSRTILSRRSCPPAGGPRESGSSRTLHTEEVRCWSRASRAAQTPSVVETCGPQQWQAGIGPACLRASPGEPPGAHGRNCRGPHGVFLDSLRIGVFACEAAWAETRVRAL